MYARRPLPPLNQPHFTFSLFPRVSLSSLIKTDTVALSAALMIFPVKFSPHLAQNKKLKKLKTTKPKTSGGGTLLSVLRPSARPEHAHSRSRTRTRTRTWNRSRRQGQILFRFAFGALLLTATCGHTISLGQGICVYGRYIYLRSCHICCTDIVPAARRRRVEGKTRPTESRLQRENRGKGVGLSKTKI